MKNLLVAMAIAICAVSTAGAGEIRLFAAASLREVVGELADGFARKNPGCRVSRNFGASGSLARQIESGAAADIFISAAPEWVSYLQGRRVLVPSSISVLAHNSLVFVAPREKRVASLQELASLERIAIGSPKSVPAGEYAMEAMRRGGVERLLEKRLVMARDVRECLKYAERGEVDGAFVYRSDALLAREVAVKFVVPRDLYPRVTYQMGLTSSGALNREASAFHAYLQGGAARAILARHGFDPLGAP